MGSIDAPEWLKNKMKQDIASKKQSTNDVNSIPAPDFLKKKVEPTDLNSGSEISTVSLDESVSNPPLQLNKDTFSDFILNPVNAVKSTEPTVNSLDKIEKQKFIQQNGYQRPKLEQGAIISSIVAERNNPVAKYNNGKSFLEQDMNSIAPPDTFSKFLLNPASDFVKDPEQLKKDVLDEGDAEVNGKIPSIAYANARKSQIDSQIQDLKNRQYITEKPLLGRQAGANIVKADNFDELQGKIDELTTYKTDLTNYTEPIAKVQVFRATKEKQVDPNDPASQIVNHWGDVIGTRTSKENLYREIGMNYTQLFDPITVENKKKSLETGTDKIRNSDIVSVENYGYEKQGISTSIDALDILHSQGKIDNNVYESERGKLLQANNQLLSKYPAVRMQNIKGALGQILDSNRDVINQSTGQTGVMKSLWENIIHTGYDDKEIQSAIDELNAKGANITKNEAEFLINSKSDIGNTALLGRAILGTVNLENKLETTVGLQSQTDYENAKHLIEQRGQNTPNKAIEQPQTIISTEGNVETNPQFMQPVSNPDAGLHNWGWGTVNLVADGVGTLAKLYALTELTGGLADELVGSTVGTDVVGIAAAPKLGQIVQQTALSASQRQTIGTIAGMYLDTYQEAKDAAKNFIGDEQGGEAAREMYANLMGLTNGIAWTILPANKIVQDITQKAATVAAEDFAKLIPAEGIAGLKENTVADFVTNTLKNTAEAQGKMTSISALTQIGQYTAQAMYNPQSVESRNLGQEITDGALQGLSFLPVMLLEGRGLAKNIETVNDFTKEAIYRVASDLVAFKDFTENQVKNGDITQPEANAKIQLINTMFEIRTKEVPDDLTKQEKVEYANNLLFTKKLHKENESIKDPVQTKKNDEKIAELEKRREEILNNSTGKIPTPVITPITATTPEKTATTKDLIPTGKPIFTDFDGTIFKDGQLTPIGEELKAKIAKGEDVTVLTSRQGTEENINFISEQLGIDKSKIKTDLSPEGKASNLIPDAIFIDDKLVNREAAKQVGATTIDPNNISGDKPEVVDVPINKIVSGIGTYNGIKGDFTQEGQRLIFTEENGVRSHDIGNLNEIKDQKTSEFGIEYTPSKVEVTDNGTLSINGESFVASKEYDPLSTVKKDDNGDIISIVVRGEKSGEKKMFKGQVAEDIAYQLHLKEITKDNESTNQFEQFINTPEIATVIHTGLSEVTQKETTGNNGEVQKSEAGKIIQTLETKKEVPPFEFKAMMADPISALQNIADQALGIGRDAQTGERLPLHENAPEPQLEATIRKYGKEVVDKAIAMFPAENKSIPDLKGLRDDDFAAKYFDKEEYKKWTLAEIENPDLAKQMIKDKKAEIISSLKKEQDGKDKKTNAQTEGGQVLNDPNNTAPDNKGAVSSNVKPVSDRIKGKFNKLKTKTSENKSIIKQAKVIKTIEDKAADAADNKNPEAAAAVEKEIENIIDKTPEQQARDAGEKVIDGTVIKRQDPLKNIVEGKSVDILFTKDDKESGNYAVIERENLQPSHKSGVLNENHFIPEAQPRDRGALEVLKNEAKNKADKLDPNQLADNNIAYFGAPVVNERGEVIQGNGRAEAIDYYYNNDKTDSRGYKEMLQNKATDLGLDADAISKMKEPVLVKLTKADDLRAIELGNLSSSDLEDVKQKGADVKAAFNRLTPAKVKELSDAIGSKIDETTTLKQIIRDNIKVVLDKLFDLGALRKDNKEQYIDKQGEVTPHGIQSAYDIVRQLLFEGGSSDLQSKFDELPARTREAIEKTIPAILGNPELKAKVQEAIEIMREQQESGTEAFSTWRIQRDIFGDQQMPADKYDKSLLDFAQGITEAKTQKEISEKIIKLSQEMNGKPADMFFPAEQPKRFGEAYNQPGVKFAIKNDGSTELTQMKEIVRDIQNEYASKDEKITLDEIKTIAKNELGNDYNEQLVEEAYHEAGKESRAFKRATAIQNELAKRVEEFTGSKTEVLPNSDALINKANELSNVKFQKSENEKIPKDFKQKAEQIKSMQDANTRFDNGERIFGVSEQDNKPIELNSSTQFDKYTYDQLYAYPALESKSVTPTDVIKRQGVTGEITIPIKVDGNEMDVKYLDEYKGKKIVEIDGNVHVYDPKNETVFNVALDDSNGHKINQDANNVETAKQYIDWSEGAKKENKFVKPIDVTPTDVVGSEVNRISDKVVNKEKLTDEEKKFIEDNKKEVTTAIGKKVIEKGKQSKPIVTETNPQEGEHTVQSLLKKYNEDTKYGIFDLVNDVENLAKENGDKKLLDAVNEYRGEEEYDKELKGRNDMTAAEDNFVNSISKSENKPIVKEDKINGISFMKSPGGEILGFTHEGKIYLNGEHLNPNTHVHEAGHIWVEVAKEKMPAVYKRGIELINGSAYLKKAQSNEFYKQEAAKLPKAERKAYFEHEALAMAIGDKGAQFITEARRKSFIDWAKDLWNKVATLAGFKDVTAKELQDMTLEDFANRAAGDILKGKEKNVDEIPPPEEPIKLKPGEAKPGEPVLVSHEGMQNLADDFGLTDVTSREHQSDLQDKENASATAKEWHDKGTYAENIDRLITNIEAGKGSNPVEKNILQQHIANVREEAASIKNIFSKEYNDKINELERLKKAGALLKSTAGATLRDTTIFSDADPTMADWMAERKEVLEVDELTNGQKEEIQNIWKEYETNLKTADDKVSQAEQQIEELKAQLAVKSERQKRTFLRSKNKEALKTERDSIVQNIKDKINAAREKAANNNIATKGIGGRTYLDDLYLIAPDVSKLVTNLIDTGINKLGDIVDNIHATLIEAIPELTKRDVHNIIAGEYNDKRPTLTALQYAKKDVIEEAKLINKLEKLQNGEPIGPERSIRKRNQEITDLRNKIKEYRKYDQSARTPEQILNAIKKSNEARQKKIDEKIANKDFSTQKQKPPLDENKMLKQANPELWKQTMDAINAKEESGHQFELLKRKDELAKRGPLKKYIVDPAGKLITTFKAIKAGIDDSVTMVQLMMAVYSNPKAGFKAKIAAFRDINNTTFKRQLASLHNSVYWDTIQKSGLDITEPQSFGKKEVEELFSGNLLDDKFKIPMTGLKVNPWTYTGGIFERIFTSMGNNLRLNLFYDRIAMLEGQGKTFDSHPEEYKGAARAINELTGRGKVADKLKTSMDAISPIIWAPKMLASTFNTLGITDVVAALRGKKGVYRDIPPQQARYLGWQMAKGIGMGVSVMAALALRGWGIDKDPRSSTFGNVTSPDGNTKYNVFGRFGSLVKTVVQMASGERVESSGSVTDIDKSLGARGKVGWKFIRGKMTPASGIFADYWLNNKTNTFTKQPINLASLPNDLISPISFSALSQGLKNDGTTALLTRFLPELEGIQVSDKRDYKTIASSLSEKTVKYLKDKNITEPYFNPKQIEIKQMTKGVGEIKKLSDFDEATQVKYEKTHSQIFDKELETHKNSFVFKDVYGSISLNSNDKKDKKLWVKDLEEKDMKKLVSILNGKATEKTKELLFKEYKK